MGLHLLYVVFAVLGSLVMVVLIRAFTFHPSTKQGPAIEPVYIDITEAFARLSELVKIPTVSYHDWSLVDRKAYARFWNCCQKYYPRVFETCSVCDIGQSAKLFHWKGKSANEPLVLMAHFDVVPATAADWEKPPFDGIIENNVLWGRGTIDTKCTLHGILEAAEKLLSEDYIPEHDIYFSFSGDEEVIGPSAPAVVDWLKERGIKPLLVMDEGGGVMKDIIPGLTKPTAAVGVGEKGYLDLEITATRKGGHASAPLKNSATTDLIKAMTKLSKKPMKPRLTPPVNTLLNNIGRHLPFYFRIIFANLWLFKPLLLKAFMIIGGEAAAFVHTTFTPTMLKGSDARNVIPGSASATYNSRILGGETLQDVENHFKKITLNNNITVTRHRSNEATPFSPSEGKAWVRMESTISEVFPEAVITPYLMIAGSDAKHFHAISDNVLRFSPMHFTLEDVRLIHGANERIRQENLAQIIEFYIRLMKKS